MKIPRTWLWGLLLALAVVGFLHLSADFPNHSRWVDDSAKFGDEGWWAAGAINHILIGHWLRPGDYNPMVSVPVWPALLSVLFHFTGVSIVAARATAFAFTIGTVLVCGALVRRSRPGLAPWAMLLIGTSPTLYFFSHLAILEPALLFFLCCAALTAYAERPPGMVRSMACGALLTVAVLTKSSGLFVAPAIFYLLWFPHRGLWVSPDPSDRAERSRAQRAPAIAAAIFLILYGLYWAIFMRTHMVDVHVFYQNNRPVFDRRSLEKAVRLVYRCFTWIDPILFSIALAALLLSVRRLRTLWQEPLFGFAVLFYFGYSAFMVYHFEAPPRYFSVLVVPVMLMVALLLDALGREMPPLYRLLGALALVAVAAATATIVWNESRPQYTYRDTCLSIRALIDSDPSANRLVIGHAAQETTYFTGIPALDDQGAMPEAEKMDYYNPGWLLAWTYDVPSLPEDRTKTLVGVFSAYDDPRRELSLYRLRPR